ncbi:MAG: PIN domain-containing protein [Candidatus Methylomirabilis sp.]|nr:PIN domain-containing protein [Deltaproteobacteria bacterium]
MDRLFLDANVLFSAAYRTDSGLRALWRLRNVERVTSEYAVEEARRNLETVAQRRELDALLLGVEVLANDLSDFTERPAAPVRAKDRPIVRAALRAGATHLITGDRRDFGAWFGKSLEGVRVATPGEYLRARKGAQ